MTSKLTSVAELILTEPELGKGCHSFQGCSAACDFRTPHLRFRVFTSAFLCAYEFSLTFSELTPRSIVLLYSVLSTGQRGLSF